MPIAIPHELLVEDCARQAGFGEISVSHRLCPLIKLISRGDTTLLNAYLNPVLKDYLLEIRSCVPDSQLELMTSAGGLMPASQFLGKDSILSGPAGGVVGAARVAVQAGFPRAIGFDMGGRAPMFPASRVPVNSNMKRKRPAFESQHRS
ncbi:MAG: hydantoinase/oxoprolinase family protein [Planctomycetaceae bacterium]